MFSPSAPCSRIREFQQKMQEDLGRLAVALAWPRSLVEEEADRAMILMLEWEEKQHGLDS
jgi:hypothetical protein